MKKCSKCAKPHKRKGQRYCVKCHNAYMRAWRTEHRPSDEQREKSNSRAYAKVYQRRGKLAPQPCACGSSKVEKHHPDYSRPLDVVWICRPCHMKLHRKAA